MFGQKSRFDNRLRGVDDVSPTADVTLGIRFPACSFLSQIKMSNTGPALGSSVGAELKAGSGSGTSRVPGDTSRCSWGHLLVSLSAHVTLSARVTVLAVRGVRVAQTRPGGS